MLEKSLESKKLSMEDDVKGKHPNIIQRGAKLNLGNKINNTLEFVVINSPLVLGGATYSAYK